MNKITLSLVLFMIILTSCTVKTEVNNKVIETTSLDEFVKKEESKAEKISKHVLTDADKEKIKSFYKKEYHGDKNYYYFDIDINIDGTYDISAQLCHEDFRNEAFCIQLTKDFCKYLKNNGLQECFNFISIMYVTDYIQTSYWYGVRKFNEQTDVENAVVKLP